MARYGVFAAVISIVLLAVAGSAHSACTTVGAAQESVDSVYPRMSELLSHISSDITVLRALLDKELNASPRFKAAWDEATTIFGQRQTELVSPGFEWVPQEYHIAVIAYTLSQTPAWPDTAFYSDFNKQTRELCTKATDCHDDLEGYPFKSEFKLLSLAIDALSFDPKFRNPKPTYYRGAGFGFALCEGQEIEFQSFTSTSTDQAKAIEYSRNVTLFEFSGPNMPKSIYVKYHSGFPEEEEVLVSPLVTYKVQGIDTSSAPIKYFLTPGQTGGRQIRY